MKAPLSLLVLLVACRADVPVGDGIAVGNPGSTALTTARSAGAPLLSAEALLAEVRLVTCAGEAVPLATNVALGLDGSSTLALPSGSWCGLGLSFDGTATFRHEVDEGTLELQLELGDIEASGPSFKVEGGSWLARLAPEDWVDPTDWTIAAGETLVVAPGDPEHDALATSVAAWLLLARDRDGDGEVGDNEAPVAYTPAAEPEEDDDDDDDDEVEEEEES